MSGALIVKWYVLLQFCVLVRFKDGDYDDYCKETTVIRIEMGQPRVYNFSLNLSSVYICSNMHNTFILREFTRVPLCNTGFGSLNDPSCFWTESK